MAPPPPIAVCAGLAPVGSSYSLFRGLACPVSRVLGVGDDLYRLARVAAGPWRSLSLYEDCVQVAAVALWRSEGSGLSDGVRVVDARRRIVDDLRCTVGRPGTARHAQRSSEVSLDGFPVDVFGVWDSESLSVLVESFRPSGRERSILWRLLAGWTVTEVADELGVTPSRVSQVLRELGRRQDRSRT